MDNITNQETTEVVLQEKKHEVSQFGAFSNMNSFKEIYDIGKMFASSTLVPQHYQGKSMDCTIAVDMANRMNVSPMMVMQNLYVVQGKPSWSGQACTTLIASSGKFKPNSLEHVYFGDKNTDEWGCYLKAINKETGEPVRGPEVTIKMAKDEGWYFKKGSKWQTMPELMLAYRASAFFARIHCPASLMGVQVEGEVEDTTERKSVQQAPDVFQESEVVENA